MNLAVRSPLGHRLLVALICACSVHASAAVYSAKEIDARVVDVETKQPIEGANVVAHWVLKFGLEGTLSADLMLMEAVTDEDGRFHFPAWGPIAVPAELPPFAFLRNQDPEIIIFKSGYRTKGLYNDRPTPGPGPGALVRTSDWNGRTIELAKFTGDMKKYAFLLGGVLTGVSWGGCEWKKIPRMIVALNKEDERMRQEGAYRPTLLMPAVVRPSIAHLEANAQRNQCGSVSEFLKGYTK